MATLRISCTPATIIVLLTVLFLRFVTIGYLVLGFILKYDEGIFSEAIFSTINQIKLNSLSLGTTIDGLTLSPMVHFLVHTIFGVIGVLGVAFRNKLLMFIFTAVNFLTCMVNITYLIFYCWVLSKIDEIKSQMSTIFQQYGGYYPQEWIEFFNRIKCAGVTGQQTTPSGWWHADQTVRGCYDVYSEALQTYLACFITMVIIHIIGGVILIMVTEVAYRQQNLSELEKQELGDTIWRVKFGMLGELKQRIVRQWRSDKLIFLSSVTISIFTIANAFFWCILLILFVGEYRDSSMWTALNDVTRETLRIGKLAKGLSITLLILIPLGETGKAVYFVGVNKYIKDCLGFFTGLQIFLALCDFLFIVMVTFILKVYYACPYYESLYIKEICNHTGSLYQFGYIFLAFMIARLLFHIIQCALSDRIFKRIQEKTVYQDTNNVVTTAEGGTAAVESISNQAEASGFFLYSLRFSVDYCKRSTFRAVTIGVNSFVTLWMLVFWLGIIVVHYGFDYHSTMQTNLRNISRDKLNLFYVDRVIFWFLAICLPITLITKIILLHGFAVGRLRQVFVSLLFDAFNVILFITLIPLTGILRKLSSCCGKNTNHFCRFSIDYSFSALDTTDFCSMTSYLPVYTKAYSTTMVSVFSIHAVLMILTMILGDRCCKHISTNQGEEEQGPFYKYIVGPVWMRLINNRFINKDKMEGYAGLFGVFSLLHLLLTVLDIIFYTLLLVQYFRNSSSSEFISTLNHFGSLTYTYGYYYKYLAICLMVFVPVNLISRSVSVVGLMYRRKYLILSTIAFLAIYIALLGLSVNLFLFGECCDSLSCSYSKYSNNATAFDQVFCESYDDTIRTSMEATLTYLSLHIAVGIIIFGVSDRLFKHINKLAGNDAGFFKHIKNAWSSGTPIPVKTSLFVALGVILILHSLFIISFLILDILVPDLYSTWSSLLERLKVVKMGNTDMRYVFSGMIISLIVVISLNFLHVIIGLVSMYSKFRRIIKMFAVSSFLFAVMGIVEFIFACFSVSLHQCCSVSYCMFEGVSDSGVCSSHYKDLKQIVWITFAFTLWFTIANFATGGLAIRMIITGNNIAVSPEINATTELAKDSTENRTENVEMRNDINPDENTQNPTAERERSALSELEGNRVLKLPAINPSRRIDLISRTLNEEDIFAINKQEYQ